MVALGIWQIERRAWKLDLIERVEARVRAAPVAAPGPAAWPTVTEGADAYRHVRLSGRFLDGSTVLVQAVTVLGGGFWVLTPLVVEGFTVLVNRGFVPSDRRDPAGWRHPEGAVTVTGLLRITEPGGAFLRSNAPAEKRWYSRDVAAIASAQGLAGVAPYFVDADAAPEGGLPVGGLTVVAFHNNHLVYALTWFTLAAMVLGGAIYVHLERRR